MLALSSLAAGSDEERGKVQSLTLTACPPSYKQVIADHQQKVSNTWSLNFFMQVCIYAPSWTLASHQMPCFNKVPWTASLSGGVLILR